MTGGSGKGPSRSWSLLLEASPPPPRLKKREHCRSKVGPCSKWEGKGGRRCVFEMKHQSIVWGGTLIPGHKTNEKASFHILVKRDLTGRVEKLEPETP